MLKNPATKYHPCTNIQNLIRTWPDKTITHPPIWLSTDLRDGNQALIEPMDIKRKLRLFHLLVEIGFQEIEIAFPSASQTDFDFVRHLIEHHLIPDSVTIQVLTPAREPLIRRTFEALQGAKQAIVHLYNATSPVFRRTVFGLDRLGTIAMAVSAAQLFKELAAQQPDTRWQFEYSPETFTATELDFAKEICEAVLDVWQPTPQQKAIVNLPATVEVSTPNIFADRVEWMHCHLSHRDSLILSVHPHNDRGCGIAAAELAVMAGAERVEGCLLGNGERTGNVDLIVLALNLYTQGIAPGLDFSNIDKVAQTVEDCTQLPVHPRHPYVGDLVFTAFSGSHQDAIKKGLTVQKTDSIWEVPYLPIDPTDVGRTYESVIRVNSQSGKGGIAFLLERDYNLVLPRRLQIQFSQAVQGAMDERGQEMSAVDLWDLFEREYLQATSPLKYVSHYLRSVEDEELGTVTNGDRPTQIVTTMEMEGKPITLTGQGNGLLDALWNALGLGIGIRHYEERSLSQGSDAKAIAIIEVAGDGFPGSEYGVGIHTDIAIASFLAVESAVNRLMRLPASYSSKLKAKLSSSLKLAFECDRFLA